MSTDIIQAQYDQLHQIASRFASQAERNQAMLQQVEQRSQVLEGGAWQGRGINAFSILTE